MAQDDVIWYVLTGRKDAVKAFVAQLAVPNSEPVNDVAITEPGEPLTNIEPVTIKPEAAVITPGGPIGPTGPTGP